MIRSHAREFREAIFPFCNPRLASCRIGKKETCHLFLAQIYLTLLSPSLASDATTHRKKKKRRKKKERKNSTVFRISSNPEWWKLVVRREGNRIGIRAIYNAIRGKVVEKFARFFAGLVELPVTTSSRNDFFVLDLSLETIFLFINARLATR